MNMDRIVISSNASLFRKIDPSTNNGIFYPSTTEEVLEAIAISKRKAIAITVKGGGSGLSGTCTGGNVTKNIISTLRLKKMLSIDQKNKIARIQAGITPDELNRKLPEGMRFRVAPSSRDTATIGGMLNTDAGGNDAWIHGTMRDNVESIELITSSGSLLEITREGIKTASDQDQARKLAELGFNIYDIANSNGTLGFINELSVKLKPVQSFDLVHCVLEFESLNDLGSGIKRIIENNVPIIYGETVIKSTKRLNLPHEGPMIIIDHPSGYENELSNAGAYRNVDEDVAASLKQLRLNLPKTNPEKGVQDAIFEGYGFSSEILPKLGDKIALLDDLLENKGFKPFLRYGHAPSIWYAGINDRHTGLIMHERDIRPDVDNQQIYSTVIDIVEFCDREKIRPKPEHKWIFTDGPKLQRLMKLREILGIEFNPFIIDSKKEDLANLIL
ncbi:MAG: FAD-binding oxidoreductase [Candidatus Hodarchaeales archaeon]